MGVECYDTKSKNNKRNQIVQDKKDLKPTPQISLLKYIKSKYIIHNLFSFMTEGKKLKIMKYNKFIQKKLQIYINDYEIFSGRYKMEGNNGKVKEYSLDGDKLVFEGEYLNGKRNVLVKEYSDSGFLSFECEFLNGQKNGKGKEYYFDGSLFFEGEYLNGKRNGKGKIYYT